MYAEKAALAEEEYIKHPSRKTRERLERHRQLAAGHVLEQAAPRPPPPEPIARPPPAGTALPVKPRRDRPWFLRWCTTSRRCYTIIGSPNHQRDMPKFRPPVARSWQLFWHRPFCVVYKSHCARSSGTCRPCSAPRRRRPRRLHTNRTRSGFPGYVYGISTVLGHAPRSAMLPASPYICPALTPGSKSTTPSPSPTRYLKIRSMPRTFRRYHRVCLCISDPVSTSPTSLSTPPNPSTISRPPR